MRNTLLIYEYEFSFVAYGYNVLKRRHELTKLDRKEINFITRIKYAEQKTFCICIDVYQIYQGDDFNEFFNVLTKFKIKKLKINNILVEK